MNIHALNEKENVACEEEYADDEVHSFLLLDFSSIPMLRNVKW